MLYQTEIENYTPDNLFYSLNGIFIFPDDLERKSHPEIRQISNTYGMLLRPAIEKSFWPADEKLFLRHLEESVKVIKEFSLNRDIVVPTCIATNSPSLQRNNEKCYNHLMRAIDDIFLSCLPVVEPWIKKYEHLCYFKSHIEHNKDYDSFQDYVKNWARYDKYIGEVVGHPYSEVDNLHIKSFWLRTKKELNQYEILWRDHAPSLYD